MTLDTARARCHVEQVMGTVVSIDIRDPEVPEGCVAEALRLLHDADERFSPFLPESEVSRLERGDLRLEDCSADLHAILAACEELRAASGGAFDVRYAGRLDPCGYVKGWAVDRAAAALWGAGLGNAAVNVGGDCVVRGGPAPGRPWRVGIRHPELPDRTAAVVALRGGAIATSGLYERGGHIVDPSGRGRTGELLSISVLAPTLAQADGVATAALVLGRAGVDWALAQPGCEVVALTAARRVLSSAGVELIRSDPAAASSAGLRPGAR